MRPQGGPLSGGGHGSGEGDGSGTGCDRRRHDRRGDHAGSGQASRHGREEGRLLPESVSREVDAELAFHLEERVRDYMAQGLDEASARRAALERLGDLSGVRQACADLLEADRRTERRRARFDDLRQDLAFAVRSALKAPLFTVLAVLTLALGIGANAAVFVAVKSALLDALPYRDSGRLVRIYGRLLDGSAERSSLSPGAVADYVARQRSFEAMAAFYPSTYDATYRPDTGPRLLSAALVDSRFIETLGVRPTVGRSFTEAEVESNAFVVMLSHELWRREFGGDAGVIGRAVHINADTWTVVGVLPPGFVGPMGAADLWFGLRLGPSPDDAERARRSHWVGLVGRLRPGVGEEVAQRDLSAIAADLAREHPDTDGGRGVRLVSLRASMLGDTRTPLLVLMASAGLVLLMMCANLAGAFLSRTMSRRREIAVRLALGAGRGRLVRQLLTESTALSLAGVVVGLGLAGLGLAALRGLATPVLPSWVDLSLDGGAVTATLVVAVGAGLALGLAPALSLRSSVARDNLCGSPRSIGETPASRRLRGVLLSVQLTLCLGLLVDAGLLARSLQAMTSTPLGFDPDGVLTVSTQGPVPAPDADRRRFFRQLEERVRSLPGVQDVAHTRELPGPGMSRTGLAVRGGAWPSADGPPLVAYTTVSDGYFRTLRIPLLRGRTFGPEDATDTPTAIVISEGMVRRYWPDGDALGARVRLGPDTAAPWGQVVGIVGDVRNDPTGAAAEPTAYGSDRQAPLRSTRTYVIRADGDPLDLVRPFRRELAGLDPSVPMDHVVTMRTFLGQYLVGRKLPAFLVGGFAVLALLLACVGVYALFSNMVVAREREIGVRLALGSRPAVAAALVLRQGARWLLAGLAGGAMLVALTAHGLRGLLFQGVGPLDPLALGLAAAMLVSFGAAALWIPLRRVLRAEPRAVLW